MNKSTSSKWRLRASTAADSNQRGHTRPALDREGRIYQRVGEAIVTLQSRCGSCKGKGRLGYDIIVETKDQLEASEAKANYQQDKISITSKLQQELSQASVSNAVLNAKLVAANESLDAGRKQNAKESKEFITDKQASYDKIKSQSDILKDIVQSGISSTLDGKLSQTQVSIEESNDTQSMSMIQLPTCLFYPAKQARLYVD